MEIAIDYIFYINLRKLRLIEKKSKKYFEKLEPLNQPKLRIFLKKK